MQTHVKEALASLGAAAVIAALIHAGIWFTLFGTPNFEVLGYPFHYFWFIAGAPFAMFVVYWLYFKYVSTRIQPEKDEMKAAAERTAGGGESSPGPEPTVSPESGGDLDD